MKDNSSFLTGMLLAMLFAITIGTFTITDGISMEPTYAQKAPTFIMHNTIINKEPERFDVISAKGPSGDNIEKRIIGLPGETVDYIDGDVYINGEYVENPYVVNKYQQNFSITYAHVELGPDEYYILGDNQGFSDWKGQSATSQDSRFYGPIKKDKIKGFVLYVLNME